MNKPMIDRRAFLATTGAFTLSFAVPNAKAQQTGAPAAPWTAYLTIGADGKLALLSPTTEMGQGTHTAHAAIIADEIGVPLSWVSVDTALPSDPFRRGGSMGSGGSAGVRAWWGALRTVGANARASLIAAAAGKAGVPAAEITLDNGRFLRAGKPLAVTLGEAATLAAGQPLVEGAPKDPATYRLVGKATPRVDVPAKVRGEPVFSADFTRPGMVYACAVLAPVYGGDAESWDDKATLAVKGVEQVVKIPGGAAVVAKSQWAAMKGAAALNVRWKSTVNDGMDSAAISAAMHKGLGKDAQAIVGKVEGDPAAALARAAKTFQADYEAPYLCHAPMEPWSITVEPTADGGLEIWGPFQTQDRNRNTAARTAGIDPSKVKLHTLMLGGGYGRRLGDDGTPGGVVTALAVKKPVKFFWRREDEIGQGWYRPAQVARLKAGVDAGGKVTALHIRTAGPSMRDSFAPGGLKQGELDVSSVQTLTDTRYRTGAYRVDWVRVDQPVPMAPWRAVGATQNGYFMEAFVDELAAFLKKDPVALRRELLAHDPRALKVIDEAAKAGDWGKPLKKGHARGFAYVESYGSLCAQVVEVSLGDGGVVNIHKAICVLDCARVVTPDGARNQVEGGMIQGLSTALFEGIEISGGRATNTNFDGYRILRMNESPHAVETVFIENGETIGGVGEPPVPPATPALVNALFALTGKPIRKLPISATLAG
jgi:isoquinoline 1-oxidoreductase beta subunit